MQEFKINEFQKEISKQEFIGRQITNQTVRESSDWCGYYYINEEGIVMRTDTHYYDDNDPENRIHYEEEANWGEFMGEILFDEFDEDGKQTYEFDDINRQFVEAFMEKFDSMEMKHFNENIYEYMLEYDLGQILKNLKICTN